MSIAKALFVPNSVVDKGTYWVGTIILIVVGALLSMTPLFVLGDNPTPEQIAMVGIFGFVTIILIYPWFCLIGGRLRDAGASPFWFIAGLVGYFILSMIISMVVMMPMMMGNMDAMIDTDPADANAMMAMQADMMKDTIPLQAIGGSIASLITAAVFGFLPHKPKTEPSDEF